MLFVVEWLLIFTFWILLLTQVGIPLWRGTPLLPLFHRETALRAQLREKAQKEIENELERRLRSDAGSTSGGPVDGGGAGACDAPERG